MNHVVSVYNTTAPDTNYLSPKNLANDIEGLATALLALQGYSLVLIRQPQLISPADDFELSSKTIMIQTLFKRHANYALNNLLPDAIQVVTDAGSTANLMNSLQATLPQILNNSSSLISILKSLESNLESFHFDSQDLADRISREFSKVDSAEKTLDEMITEVIDKLEKPGGEISKISQEISTKKEEIELNISAIIESSKTLSKGIKSLVTGTLTSFVPDEEGSTENSNADNEDDKDGLDSSSISSNTSNESDTFSVESIGAIESGVSDGEQNVKKLIENNHELADLYQKLARLNGLLAATKAVRDQIHDYKIAIQKLSIHAAHVETSWSEIQSGFKSMEKELQKKSDEDTGTNAMSTIAIAVRHWQRVNDRVQTIESALSGVEGSFSNFDNPEPSFK